MRGVSKIRQIVDLFGWLEGVGRVAPPCPPEKERRLPTNQRSRMQNVVRLGAFHSWGTPLHPAEPSPPGEIHFCGQGRTPRPGGATCETFRFGSHVCGRLARSGAFGAVPGSRRTRHSSHCLDVGRFASSYWSPRPGVDRRPFWDTATTGTWAVAMAALNGEGLRVISMDSGGF